MKEKKLGGAVLPRSSGRCAQVCPGPRLCFPRKARSCSEELVPWAWAAWLMCCSTAPKLCKAHPVHQSVTSPVYIPVPVPSLGGHQQFASRTATSPRCISTIVWSQQAMGRHVLDVVKCVVASWSGLPLGAGEIHQCMGSGMSQVILLVRIQNWIDGTFTRNCWSLQDWIELEVF